MKSLFILFLALACVSAQFNFNPFRAFNRRPRPNNRPPPPRPFNSQPSRPANNAPPPSNGGGQCDRDGFHVSASRGFSWGAADSYCRGRGMRLASLDNPQKVNAAIQKVRPLPYFWTGGRKTGRNAVVNWPNGSRSNPGRWSRTGGRQQPQPDNREGNEDCVAILNNFYNDGIVFHDVACHHRKPALCEC